MSDPNILFTYIRSLKRAWDFSMVYSLGDIVVRQENYGLKIQKGSKLVRKDINLNLSNPSHIVKENF